MAVSLLSLSACSTQVETTFPNEGEPTLDSQSSTESELITLLQDGDTLSECDVEWEKNWVDENTSYAKEDIRACYDVFDVSILLIDDAGKDGWNGLALRKTAGLSEDFFKIPEEGFFPVALSLEEEQLTLTTQNEAGSELRYVYSFAGVSEAELYTWEAERCTEPRCQ